MSREAYTSCMTPAMRAFPKGISREERSLLFCQAAKKCSGKAKSDEEARALCSLPKAPKPEGTGKHRGKKGAGAAPACDYSILIPGCEKKLSMMVKSGELGPNTDVTGICELILG